MLRTMFGSPIPIVYDIRKYTPRDHAENENTCKTIHTWH